MMKAIGGTSTLVAFALLGTGAWADEPRPTDQTKTGRHVAESRIYFAFNSAELSAAARAELDQAARWIASHKTGLILIEGHTDKVGSAEYNKGLGERRGGEARAYLVGRGVPAARIRILSYGEGLPALKTEDRAMENRRVIMFAVQKEPIVEKRTVVSRVPVYVDRPEVAAPAPKHLGIQLMVGGGLTNQLDHQTEELTEVGGTWDARVAFFNRSLIGFEAAYVGTLQNVKMFGLDDNAELMGNGAEADLRLNLLRDAVVRPYVFGGVGWTHYDVTNTPTAGAPVEDNDDVLHLPAGVGVGFQLYRDMTLDVRGTMRAAFDDEVFDPMTAPGQKMGLENWSAAAQLGFEF
jgi:peptidoglycan-associated lipoprotein